MANEVVNIILGVTYLIPIASRQFDTSNTIAMLTSDIDDSTNNPYSYSMKSYKEIGNLFMSIAVIRSHMASMAINANTIVTK